MKKNQLWKGFLCGFAATCLWASFYPVGRLLFGLDNDVEIFNMTFRRYTFAALFFLPVLFLPSQRQVIKDLFRNDWKMLLILSPMGLVEGTLLLWSLDFTTAARSSLLANFSPFITLLGAWLIGQESLNGNKVVGMIIGVAGLILAFFGQGQDLFIAGGTTLIGDLLALASGTAWAFFTIMGVNVSRKYGSVTVTSILFVMGAILSFPLTFFSECGLHFSGSWQSWLGAVYLGIFSNGMGNALWYTGLRHATAGQLGSFGYLTPVLTFMGSSAFLHEKADWKFYAAMALLTVGVALMFMKKDIFSFSAKKVHDASL